MSKYLIFFSICIFLLSGCSFDNKTGIWDDGEKKRVSKLKDEQSQKEIIKIYSTEDVFSEEIIAKKSIKLKTPKKISSWPMNGLNVQNSLGNIYLSGTKFNFLKKKIGRDKFSISDVTTSLLVHNKNIFLSDDTGTIYYVSSNGKVLWKKNIYKKVYKSIYKRLSLSIYENNIYISDNIGFIYSININTGTLVWIKNHGIPIKSNLKIFDNKIFLINQDNRILCLDTAEGSILWSVRSISSFIKSQQFLSSAISKEGDLLVLLSSGDLIKIETTRGILDWSLNITSSMYAHDTDFFASSEIVIDKQNVIFAGSGSIFSFDILNGFLNWKLNISSKIIPIVDGDNVFLISDNGYFLNVNKTSGEIVWSTHIFNILKKKKRKTKTSGVVMGSNKIYVTTENGYIIICSALSGKVESFINVGSGITTSPIISDGSLYVLTNKSKLYGFK
jgi:outer membrane protein assembly factor BamB